MAPTAPAVPAEPSRLDPSIWKITSIAALGPFLSQLDATMTSVSLSTLVEEFHSDLATIQWVTSAYLLALTLVLPLNGWLVDRIGAKRLYLWCFGAFTVSSALCGLAWSAGSLIGFRVLQGMSGGLLAPMAQMMIARAAGVHMARVAGYAAVPILIAPVLGPVIAGAILTHASWRWLFLVNVPVGVLALVLVVFFLSDDRTETRHRVLDWVGLSLLSPALVMFLFGSDHIGDRLGLLLLSASVALMAVFLWTARGKGDVALIDLRLFRGKVFSTAAVVQFLSNGVVFAGQMLMPIYLIQACGRSPGEVGLLLAPLGIGMLCTYPAMGNLTDRFGTRRVSAGGALLSLLGVLPLIYLASHAFDLVAFGVALFIRGLGQSAIGLPSISAAYASVRREDLPMATTSLNIVQRLGGPTWTTLCAIFLQWRLSSSISDSAPLGPFSAAFLFLGALQALLLMAALRLPSR